MELHPIKLATQPLAGGLEGAVIATATQPPGERGQLGGHTQLMAPLLRHGVQESTEQLLAAARETAGAIGIGRVEEMKSQGHRPPEGGLKRRVMELGPVAPEELVSPGPGAHADRDGLRHGTLRAASDLAMIGA